MCIRDRYSTYVMARRRMWRTRSASSRKLIGDNDKYCGKRTMTLSNFVYDNINDRYVPLTNWTTCVCRLQVTVVTQTADSGGGGRKMTRGVRITDWSLRCCWPAAICIFRGYKEMYYKNEVTNTHNRGIRIRRHWHFCCEIRRHLTIWWWWCAMI